jgi:hypothetical protein
MTTIIHNLMLTQNCETSTYKVTAMGIIFVTGKHGRQPSIKFQYPSPSSQHWSPAIRQLWRDNRDSSNYYTFWLVVAFGLLSVTLAMFSLAVSVAQTWASFRALDQSSSPSVSST